MLKQLVDQLTVSPLVGVDLGSAAVKLVELTQTGGRLTLHRCAIESIEGKDPTDVLKRLVSESGITTSGVVLALASPRLVVKPFEFPAMPKKDLSNAIHLEAEQSILNGHSLSEIALDWHTFAPSSKETIRGVFSAVPKGVVEARLKTVRAAGLRPSIVDIEGLALWNAYWTLVGSQEPILKTVLLLNIGVRTTNVVIAKGRDALILVRDVQLGAQALGDGHAQDWATEILDSLGYARSQGGLRALESIYVTGGGSGPHVISHLKSISAAPLTFWNPLNQVERDAHSPPVDEALGPLLAVAIGLALRQPT